MRLKQWISAVLAAALALSLCAVPASAKTLSSARADNIFFYALNAEGKSVLLKVMTLDELKELAHGQSDGKNYYISTTDNYPTTQYCEARGLTVNELVNHVKSVTTVEGADAIGFSGQDTLRLMATDSYGNYSRAWTWKELYGETRYYFEGLFNNWNTGWEIAGEDNSMYGITLEEYNAQYKDSDPYYEVKRSVFAGGVETQVILATESYSGRTTSSTLVASTEPGISHYLEANGGKAAGSLANVLDDECALRLSLPMTEADLMAAHRTAFDNFKWIYNLRLDMASAPALPSLGTVAEPVPSFSLNGNTLTITFTCGTPGADIYYSFDGSPQTLYTEPVTVDVTDQNLDSSPVTIYATAVQEGWDDAGVLSFQYPGMAPAFQTVYSGMTGNSLTFQAASKVDAGDWSAWTGALSFISMKAPSSDGYAVLEPSKYTIDNEAMSVTFDQSLFTTAGSYSFIFHADKYANKNVSVTMKKASPTLSAADRIPFGEPITVFWEDDSYNSGLMVYVTPAGGKRTMISSSYLDRTQEGRTVILEEYFTSSSTAMPGAGIYTLELVNNGFDPATQTITVTLTQDFSDVLSDDWFYDYVTDLVIAGVVNGIGDNLFDPEGTVTWGEAMKLLLLTAGYEELTPTGDHWASGYIDQAAADGLIPAELDPDMAITRLEFCQAAALLLDAQTTLPESPFTDTDDPTVLALYELDIISGMGDGTFAPEGTLTRAEISKIIWCIRNLEQEAP